MIPRHASSALLHLARGFPILAITGPRQSGKTTLARQCFPHLPYLNLEDLDTRELAASDPRRFLARFANGAVLDEVQRAPALMSYLLGVADSVGAMGRFVLTGSQQFGLMDGITQSLAGRVGMVTLLPLSHAELMQAATGSVPETRTPSALDERLWLGGYPALHAADRDVFSSAWFGSYVATYIERDVRQVLNVGNLAQFQRFVALCAARSAQLLNLNSLASDCGISQPTARQWLTVLQASHLVALLPAYHRNFGKRLVKAPKLHFLDTGLLCHLLRIASAEDLSTHAMRGAVFESWVVSETLKHRFNQALPADLHHWRDNHGLEVDLLVEHRGRLTAVECKSGATYSSDWADALRLWQRVAGPDASQPVVCWGGDVSFSRSDHEALSWRDFGLARSVSRGGMPG
jgi:uncharacterized protein